LPTLLNSPKSTFSIGATALAGALLIACLAAAVADAAPHDPSLQALADYNVILENNPDDVPTLRARGSTFRALELYDDALVDLQRSEELAPDHYETVGEIGICLYMLGDIDEACQVLERAEKLFAERPPAVAEDSETVAEDSENAAEDSETVAEDSETAAVVEKELRETLMALYRERGDYEAALEQWDLMEKYLGGKLAAKCDRADILLDLGRVDEAMELYQDAVEWNGVFERFCVGAANCLILKGYERKAIEIFERWAAEEPELALPHMHRGIIFRDHLGERDAAKEAFEIATRLADASIDDGDLPDFGNIIIQARVQQAAGDHAGVVETIGKILDYSRGHYLVVEILSVSCRALGKIDEADSLQKESRLYKRLNPRDWLQAYDIFPPEIKDAPTEDTPRDESASEPAKPSGNKDVAEDWKSYFLVVCAIVIPGAILLWLLLRRKKIE